MPNRRDFLSAAGFLSASALLSYRSRFATAANQPDSGRARIAGIEIVRYKGPRSTADHLEIAADIGAVGRFGPLGWGLSDRLHEMFSELRPLLVGRDPLDRELAFQGFWNALHPDSDLKAYAEGIDPLTGERIWGTTRDGRHTDTGRRIMALSALDNALWDLRGKLRNQPVYRLIGDADRRRIDVYTRVGEGRDLDKARRQARELYDTGHKHQKWYFVHGPKDGKEGLRVCLELVRVLREELPDAILMFDNHSMRHQIGPDWVVELAKRMLPYNPFWLEEPTAPEDVEGYAKIKGETGITVAGGEHHFTRWQIKPLLDRKCLDWVQSDPDWCGGVSEWLRVCEMAREYPGVHVVPHCDNFMTNVQCVASQPESLCPMAEYNGGQTQSKMSFRTSVLVPKNEVLVVPDDPGLGPDIDLSKCERLTPEAV